MIQSSPFLRHFAVAWCESNCETALTEHILDNPPSGVQNSHKIDSMLFICAFLIRLKMRERPLNSSRKCLLSHFSIDLFLQPQVTPSWTLKT